MNSLFEYINKKEFLVYLKEKNRFYSRLYHDLPVQKICTVKNFQEQVPFITKEMIAEDQLLNHPFGSNHSKDISEFVRFHQTSGTTSAPIKWIDTKESWSWIVDSWKTVLQKSDVENSDIGAYAFSFGPFLGFWGAFESGVDLGILCIPLGGMTSESRLDAICKNGVTVLFCTPTYAHYLGKLKRSKNIKTSVKKIIVAGEPGGSQIAFRNILSNLWDGAEIFDHHGMTEVGPVSYPFQLQENFHLAIIPNKYFVEVVEPKSQKVLGFGQEGELVVTTLGRLDCPLIRYRTGDLVCLKKTIDEHGSEIEYLERGIKGRVDQMVIIRGVNVYPSAVSSILSEVKGIAEYQTRIFKNGEMDELEILLEAEDNSDHHKLVKNVVDSFYKSLQIRIKVQIVGINELPRFEMKAKRWKDDRA